MQSNIFCAQMKLMSVPRLKFIRFQRHIVARTWNHQIADIRASKTSEAGNLYPRPTSMRVHTSTRPYGNILSLEATVVVYMK